MSLWDVTITVDVQDPPALWRAARDQMKAEAVKVQGVMIDDAEILDVLGAEARPKIGACLMMVLDRSDNLGDGGDIENTEITRVEDDGTDDLDVDEVEVGDFVVTTAPFDVHFPVAGQTALGVGETGEVKEVDRDAGRITVEFTYNWAGGTPRGGASPETALETFDRDEAAANLTGA